MNPYGARTLPFGVSGKESGWVCYNGGEDCMQTENRTRLNLARVRTETYCGNKRQEWRAAEGDLP